MHHLNCTRTLLPHIHTHKKPLALFWGSPTPWSVKTKLQSLLIRPETTGMCMCVYATLTYQPGLFYSHLHVAPKSQRSAWKGGSLHPHQLTAQVSTPTGLALLQNEDQSYRYIVVCPTWTFDTMYLFCFPLNMAMHHRMKLIGWNNWSTATPWSRYIKIKKEKKTLKLRT